jgi:UDP-N-acetylmuramoyl-L-alanyl-D-glutamate--2,6-diaminopimelate ligase
MAANHCSHAIIELPLGALNGWPTGAEFDVMCVTCLASFGLKAGAVHGADHGARPVLFEHLTPEGLAVLSADDPFCAGCLGQIDGPVLTVGIRAPSEITASLLEQSPGGQTFLLIAGNEVMPVTTRMIGTHHVTNCLLAAAVGLAYGIDLPTVVRGLEAVDHVPGRLERVVCGQPFSVFVDHARSPEGLAACLAVLREVVTGRLLCVVGAEADLDTSDCRRLGRAAEDGADLTIVTSGRRRVVGRPAPIDEVLRGFRRPEQAAIVRRRHEAIALALDRAAPGDAVLVLGDEVELIRSRLHGGRPGAMHQNPTPMSRSNPLP